MEILIKIVRTLASLPLIGGALVFVLGFFPLLAIIPFNLSTGLSVVIGGLLTAAWCYFLSAKKVINIVTPFIPIPLWILGVLMAMVGVYGIITNAWDETETTPEMVMPETKSSIKESAPAIKQETMPDAMNDPDQDAMLEQAKKLQEAEDVDLDQARRDAEDYALIQMQQSLEDMQRISEEIGPEQLDAMMKAQGDSENTMNFVEAMAEMQKQIDELKQRINDREK